MLSVSDYSVLCSWVFKVDGAQCFRLQFCGSWVFKVDVFQTTVCVAGCLR